MSTQPSPTERRSTAFTEGGKQFLGDNEETIGRIRDHARHWWGQNTEPRPLQEDRHARDWWMTNIGGEFRDTLREWGDIAHLIGSRARRLDRARLCRIKDIMLQTRRDIEEVPAGEEQRQTRPASKSPRHSAGARHAAPWLKVPVTPV